jgi:hypothetical protein
VQAGQPRRQARRGVPPSGRRRRAIKKSMKVFKDLAKNDLDRMKMVGEGSAADWDAFQSRTRGDRLYFDYTITP